MKLIRDFTKRFPTKLLEELFLKFSFSRMLIIDNLVSYARIFPRTLGTVVRSRF